MFPHRKSTTLSIEAMLLRPPETSKCSSWSVQHEFLAERLVSPRSPLLQSARSTDWLGILELDAATRTLTKETFELEGWRDFGSSTVSQIVLFCGGGGIACM